MSVQGEFGPRRSGAGVAGFVVGQMTSHRAEQRLWPVRWQLNRLDRRRSLSHYWTSPSHQFWRTQLEKQPSHSYKQPGQTVKAAGLARTMSGALRTSAASTRRAPPAAMPTRSSTPGGAAPRAATTYPDVMASSMAWPRTADMSGAETPVMATLARASPKAHSSGDPVVSVSTVRRPDQR